MDNNGNDNLILEVKDLKQWFPIRSGLLQKTVAYIRAVNGVSFALQENEVVGLVGENGCGKTTVGRTILRLYDPTGGEIWYRRKDGELHNGRSKNHCPRSVLPGRYRSRPDSRRRPDQV